MSKSNDDAWFLSTDPNVRGKFNRVETTLIGKHINNQHKEFASNKGNRLNKIIHLLLVSICYTIFISKLKCFNELGCKCKVQLNGTLAKILINR